MKSSSTRTSIRESVHPSSLNVTAAVVKEGGRRRPTIVVPPSGQPIILGGHSSSTSIEEAGGRTERKCFRDPLFILPFAFTSGQSVGRSIGGLGSYGRQAEVGSLTFQFASAIIDHNLIITGRLSSRFGSSSSQTSQNSGDICRICHCESEPGNPLLTPCYCSGSLKYVHQSCLQQWLTASETNSCELCKFPFIMHTKIKPFNEVRSLSGGFHCPSH